MPASAATTPPPQGEKLLEFFVTPPLEVHFSASSWLTVPLILLLVVVVAWKVWRFRNAFRTFEIDQAEVGIGSSKIKLLPNETDRQIAYKIWVELSTRKIGLSIDLKHDVIVEIYDSWHTFFTVTRELIKDVPVGKFRRKHTEQIVGMSIQVLNDGLRPHLTKWQARFRRWYENRAAHADFGEQSPQEIQVQFPEYEELKSDLQAVNKRLIAYRKVMYDLVVSK